MEITADNIHRILSEKMPKEDFSHWYSDLYVKVTPYSKSIVNQYKHKNMVKIFLDAIDNEPWFEIPFCYDKEVKNEC